MKSCQPWTKKRKRENVMCLRKICWYLLLYKYTYICSMSKYTVYMHSMILICIVYMYSRVWLNCSDFLFSFLCAKNPLCVSDPFVHGTFVYNGAENITNINKEYFYDVQNQGEIIYILYIYIICIVYEICI